MFTVCRNCSIQLVFTRGDSISYFATVQGTAQEIARCRIAHRSTGTLTRICRQLGYSRERSKLSFFRRRPIRTQEMRNKKNLTYEKRMCLQYLSNPENNVEFQINFHSLNSYYNFVTKYEVRRATANRTERYTNRLTYRTIKYKVKN